MNKYKCIKEYPSLGRQWKVGDICDSNNAWNDNKLAPQWPEFWEKVEDRSYEILSVAIRRPDKHQIVNMEAYNSYEYIISLANCDGNYINSIKRISDGEIFTIGDKVEWNEVKVIIESFKMVENNPWIKLSKIIGSLNIFDIITKPKLPIFTTFDGVDVFDSKQIIYGWKPYQHPGSYHNGTPDGYYFEKDTNWKWFSTEKLRDKYSVMNTLEYSEKDMLDFGYLVSCSHSLSNKLLDTLLYQWKSTIKNYEQI